jgi:NTE family protein
MHPGKEVLWRRAPARLARVFLLLLLSACSTFKPPLAVDHLPAWVAHRPLDLGRDPVALVLSGGSARGFAHIGVIKVLEANGLRPDIVVGVSAGSMIGAFYASGMSAAQLEHAASRLDLSLFNDLTLPALFFLPGELGLIRGDKLQEFVARQAGNRDIETLPLRFAAVATDLQHGTPVIFNSGDTGLAVRASSSVPVIFTPAEFGGRRYADGQLVSPLPIAAARALGAKVVIAVDATFPPGDAFLANPLSVLFQSLTIATQRIKENELPGATLVITPAMHTSSQFSISDRKMLIDAGETAALRMLPEIKSAFARSSH